MAVMKKLRCITCGEKHTVADFAPDNMPCPTRDCEGTARYRNGPSMHRFRCAKCHHQFDVLNDWRAGEDPSKPRPCTADGCDGNARALVHSVGLNDWSDKSTNFPYYDRGMGEWVRSKEHRRQLMDERGLADGGSDVDRLFADQNRRVRDQEEDDDRWWADYEDRLENSPEFANYREARDKGALPTPDDIANHHSDLMGA